MAMIAMGSSNASSVLVQLFPFFLFCAWFGLMGFLLARDKGRNVALWTVLGMIPVVNFFCIWYFVGAANLRLERKIDALLQARGIVEAPPPPLNL